MTIHGRNEAERGTSSSLQQHLLASQLIEEFQSKELHEFESPFFALKYFLKTNLNQDRIPAPEDLRNGRQFRIQLAMYALQMITKITPPLWKTILTDVYQIIEENIFSSQLDVKEPKTNQSHPVLKHTWKFRESYKTLYEDLKFKFSAMMRSTKKIREDNAREKRTTKINENLLMRFLQEKHKKLKLGCW